MKIINVKRLSHLPNLQGPTQFFTIVSSGPLVCGYGLWNKVTHAKKSEYVLPRRQRTLKTQE